MENLKIIMANIDPKLNTRIKKYVYKTKHKWAKKLNYVKAPTSGFKPKYKFFDELYDFSVNLLKEHTKEEWQKTNWWVNYYDKSDYCLPHHHKPKVLSSILIVKSSSKNPLYFIHKGKKHRIKEKDGMFLYFDSSVMHGVEACKDTRITCALDFIRKEQSEHTTVKRN
tara:strand:- start:2014 stop:2517 length:504 start_codon:yes stop_codon:yes gene_type:complete